MGKKMIDLKLLVSERYEFLFLLCFQLNQVYSSFNSIYGIGRI